MMMNRKWALPALALLLTAPAAHADPVGWSYAWSPPTAAVPGDHGNGPEVVFNANPGGHVTGPSGVLAAAVLTAGNEPGGSVDTFSGQKYALTLTLTDDASGTSGALTFTGRLFGTLGGGVSQLGNTFDSP